MKRRKVKEKYEIDSIKSLSPRDFSRLRPATYLGSNEYSTQLVREIFSNALDEHTSGRGNIISVNINTYKNKYTVEDNAQGFPINVLRDDGETVLQAAFDVMNTSGKYDEEGCYSGSLGLNGIGAKLTNYLSKSLVVSTYNGAEFETITFKDGLFETRFTGKSNHESGTIVTWEPDEQFFQNVEANDHDLKNLFESISALCPGLTINYTRDNENIVYHSENGLQDLIDTKVANKELFTNRFAIRKIVDNNLFDIVLTYTSDYSDNIIAYVNYGLTETGVHISTVKSLITKQLNKYASDNKLLKKNDNSFSGPELSEGLVIAFNIKATNVKYDSQTKIRVVDIDKTLMTTVLNNDFADWLNNNPKEARIIIDRALNARKAKEAAQKAKEGVRNAVIKGKKFINLPTKLVDAYSKDRSECELIIVEGDSAKNGMVAKRNGKTQAVFPIRGKILSCRKATMEKVYANQEISNIVKALGLDIEKDTGKLIYEAKKLRYGKILLACFTGDTKIKSLDGNFYTFKELVDKNIDSLWVYSMDEHGNIVPGKATNIRETRKTKDLIKITLDSGAEIKCTPDHLFMKADGEYCRADELNTFESLMPLYTKYVGEDNAIRECVFDRITNQFRPTHQLIAENYYNKEQISIDKNCNRLNVHHKDRNKLNNSPDNLIYLTPQEHSLEHSIDEWHKHWGETYNTTQKHRDTIKELHAQGIYEHTYFGNNGYNGSDKQKEDLKRNWKAGVYANANWSTNGYNFSEQHSKVIANVNRSQIHIDSVKKSASLKSIKYVLNTNLEFNEYNYNFYKQSCAARYNDLPELFGSLDNAILLAIEYKCDLTNYKPKYEYSHYDNALKQKNRIAKNIKSLKGLEFNEENYNSIKGPRDVSYINILNWFDTYEEALQYSENYNHRIMSIEYIHLEEEVPVYCMKVDKYHNFALASGIFSKNCDADPDGEDIRLLLINAFWWLCPDLILKGHIYAVVPPLFRITTKKNEYIYLKDQVALDNYKAKHKSESFLINRMKGLGEMNPEEQLFALLDPKTRNVQQLLADDFNSVDNMLEIFMGDNVAQRRDYLLRHYNDVEVDIE